MDFSLFVLFQLQEEIAALNLAKFSKAQAELDDSNERCDMAEAQLTRFRPGAGAAGPRGGRAPSAAL